jgi:kynurenine 3-monooxygenase
MNSNEENTKPIAIIGAGLVGSLLAILLAKRGYKVAVFERREDMRSGKISAGKSINLALSDRGWKALKEAGINEDIRKIAIPMKGRMTHDKEGNTNFLPYGKEGQAIYSVSRAGLNRLMMNIAEEYGAKINFNIRCKSVSIKNTEVIYEDAQTHKDKSFAASRIFGTDGAFSSVRLKMQLSQDRFEYSQHYLDYGYKELYIPPDKNGGFAMEKNCLHIWPRGNYMMIALPNIDGSFTATLFFPFEGVESFDSIQKNESVKNFFLKTFPDVVPLMPTLLNDYVKNPASSLVTVRCFPWSHEDKIMLLGDAAHAVVPFYGQGMNCGFEDCTILCQMMDKYLKNSSLDMGVPGTNAGWEKVFIETQKSRKPNSDAIAELAVANFIEMRDLVAHPDFILQKKIEANFSQLHPDLWTPLYTMVTFSDLPYSYALEKGKKQDAIMKQVLAFPGIEEKWDSKEVEESIFKLVQQY